MKINTRVYAIILFGEKILVCNETINSYQATKFPGGGVEKGESPEEALNREIKEELSIKISSNCVAPLTFAVDYHNTYQTILMLHVCRKWQGRPESLLGQKLQWVKPINLADYEMPRANVFLKSILRDWIATS